MPLMDSIEQQGYRSMRPSGRITYRRDTRT